MIDVIAQVRGRIDADGAAGTRAVYLSELDYLVRNAIRWDDLDAADRLAANRLLEYVLGEVEREIGHGALDPQDRMTIGRFLDLIESGVSIALSGAADLRFEMHDLIFLTHSEGSRVVAYGPRLEADSGLLAVESPRTGDKSGGRDIYPTFPPCVERGPPGGTGTTRSGRDPTRAGKGVASAGPAALIIPADNSPNGRVA